jgi:hypothetical protein
VAGDEPCDAFDTVVELEVEAGLPPDFEKEIVRRH